MHSGREANAQLAELLVFEAIRSVEIDAAK
jgi:hypothetical protein